MPSCGQRPREWRWGELSLKKEVGGWTGTFTKETTPRRGIQHKEEKKTRTLLTGKDAGARILAADTPLELSNRIV